MADEARENPEGWADRLTGRDGEAARGTSGAPRGTNGVWESLRVWLAVIALVGLNIWVNVTTELDDARLHGIPRALSRVLIEQLTSAAAIMAVVMVIPFALRLAPPGRGPLWRTIGVHLAGTVVFSVAHVALMLLLRTLVFGALRQPFGWRWTQFVYEYRKDLLAYVIVGGLFWVLRRPPPTPAPAAALAGGPVTFDIRDGASLRRAPVAEILAVKAAGNYVEFALEDGARPLMRASMAQVETALAPHGFVRTHRSWLINAERVRALSAAGSGDYRLDLGCGVTAPLSRRYPAARARLARDEGAEALVN